MTDLASVSVLVLSDNCIATATGLQFSQAITFDEWAGIGLKLHHVERSVHWWLGDWLRFGEQRWGEMYAQALETGYDYGTLRNDKWVAEKIPLVMRHDKLSFAHHQAVAALPEAEREALLTQAEQEGWSRAELRQQVTGVEDYMVRWLALKVRARELAWDETAPDWMRAACRQLIEADK